MKLSISNIGPFQGNNEILLNGITILAGENGTGKSTFGKVLYCFFSTFREINEQIENERKKSIMRLMNTKMRESGKTPRMGNVEKLVDRLFDDFNGGIDDKSVISMLDGVFDDDPDDQIKHEILGRIREVMNLDSVQIMKTLLKYRIHAEFEGQMVNVNNTDKEASACLTVKDKCLSFRCNGDVYIDNYISLVKDIIYFDDPNIVDCLRGNLYFSEDYNHKIELIDRFMRKDQRGFSSVDRVLMENKFSRIEEKINAVCEGDISFGDKTGYRYFSNTLKEGISVSNLATGLKSFVVFKQLLLDGELEDNGVIILDEPEIHLHPEWQRVWAEIIVLLHKELNINILLSTHSSDFLGFMELFIHKYEVDKNCDVYLLKKDNGKGSSVVPVGDDWDEIYGKLGRPFIRATEELESIS